MYTSARRVSCRQAGVYASRVMHASMYVYIVHRCRHAALQHSIYTRTCCLSTYLSLARLVIHGFIPSLSNSHSLFRSFPSFVQSIQSFIHSFSHSFIYPFVCSFVRPTTPSAIRPCILLYTFTCLSVFAPTDIPS